MDVDIEAAFPRAPMSPRFRRALSILVGIAALAAAVLSWAQADAGRKEEQSFVDASRGALDVFVSIAASSPRTEAEAVALRRYAHLGTEAAARVLSSRDGLPFRVARRRQLAEERASREILEAVQPMTEVDEGARRLDPATIRALGAEVGDLQSEVERQNAAVEEAGEHGTRQERSMFALGLVAIAASLLGLSGLMGDGRGGRISLVTAACAIVFAAGWGASGYLA